MHTQRSDDTARGSIPGPELDPDQQDTDRGGLPDGVEDLDGDGMVGGALESNPHEPSDDARTIMGTAHHQQVETDDGDVHTTDARIDYAMTTAADGTMRGDGHGHIDFTSVQMIPSTSAECPARTRTIRTVGRDYVL